MAKLVALFNLKPGRSEADYERWAREHDIATVSALGSVESFTLHRVSGVFGSEAPAPYRYVELIEVPDMDAFLGDVGAPGVQRVVAEFAGIADEPLFLVTEQVA